MRLVTQERPGDWEGVMRQVRDLIDGAEVEEVITQIGHRPLVPEAA